MYEPLKKKKDLERNEEDQILTKYNWLNFKIKFVQFVKTRIKAEFHHRTTIIFRIVRAIKNIG